LTIAPHSAETLPPSTPALTTSPPKVAFRGSSHVVEERFLKREGWCDFYQRVQCADGTDCVGNACCPDGSTCPSADPHYRGCRALKSTTCLYALDVAAK
jgi:hypothetical protein